VKHDVHPGDSVAAHLQLAQVATEKLDLAVKPREIRFITCAEVVYHADIVPKSHEPLGEM